jgi:hypothetical protein
VKKKKSLKRAQVCYRHIILELARYLVYIGEESEESRSLYSEDTAMDGLRATSPIPSTPRESTELVPSRQYFADESVDNDDPSIRGIEESLQPEVPLQLANSTPFSSESMSREQLRASSPSVVFYVREHRYEETPFRIYED